MFFQRLQYRSPVIGHLFLTHLVSFQRMPDQVVRQRVRVRHGRSMPDPVDCPSSGGSLPAQKACRIHCIRQIQYLICFHIRFFGNGHHCDIAIVGRMLLCAAPSFVNRQFRLFEHRFDETVTRQFCPARDNLLHSSFFRNPGAARCRIARRTLQAQFQTQTFRFRCSKAQGFPICLAAESLFRPWIVFCRRMRLLYRRSQVENSRSSDPGFFHCLEVFGDSLFGEVTSHPVPPDIRLIAISRLFKLFSQRTERFRRRFACWLLVVNASCQQAD